MTNNKKCKYWESSFLNVSHCSDVHGQRDTEIQSEEVDELNRIEEFKDITELNDLKKQLIKYFYESNVS